MPEILEYLQPAIRDNAVLFNMLSFLLGLWGGHRFALGRDRREEFVKAVIPIEVWLAKQGKEPGHRLDLLGDDEVVAFERSLTRRQRVAFRRVYKEHKDAYQRVEKRDAMGGSSYDDTPEIRKTLERVAAYTRYW